MEANRRMYPVFLLALPLLLLLGFSGVASAAWANTSFDMCMNITIINASATSMTNFPAFINLTKDPNMLSDYSDLRFFSQPCNVGGTLLAHEVENYTASYAILWVGIPTLNAANTTISVYYQNNTPVSSAANPTAVWNSNYMGVWHMQATNPLDSTPNGNNGTGTGVTLNATGKIDGALNFAGTASSYVNCSNRSSLHSDNNLTIQAWVNSRATKVNYGKIAYKSFTSAAAPFTEYGIGLDATHTNYMFELATGGTQTILGGTTAAGTGVWEYVVGVYNGSAMMIYVNGTLQNSVAKTGTINNYGQSFIIGSNGMNLPQSWNGTLDEVELSNTALSAQWINQSYQMTNNNPAWVKFGTAQPRSVANCPVVSSSYTMLNSFTGAPNSASPLTDSACVKINASNIVFNCNGYSITNNGTAGLTYGVEIPPPYTNVTIENCPRISGYYRGIIIYQANGNYILNNTVSNNTYSGIAIIADYYESVSNNTAFNNTDYGFEDTLAGGNNNYTGNVAHDNGIDGFVLSQSINDTLINNSAYNNTNVGFVLSSSSYNTLSSNVENGYGKTSDGILLSASSNNTLIGNSVSNNVNNGFHFNSNANNNNLTSNSASGISSSGFFFDTVSNNYLTANTAYNVSDGFAFGGGSNNTFISNNASNNAYGFFIYSGETKDTLTGNTAYNNSVDGFALVSSPDNTLATNTAYGNSWAGFYLTASANNNLTGNTAYNNTWYGFDLITSSNNNTFNGNSAYNNTYYGIDMANCGSMFWNTALYNNRYDLDVGGSISGFIYNMTNTTFRNPSGTLANYTVLSINDSVATGDEYFINWSGQPASLPGSMSSFAQKFVNITRVGGTPSIDRIVWSWQPAEITGDPSHFQLWRYDTGGWANMNGTVDTVANTLTLVNAVPASAYGILQLPNCLVANSSYTMSYNFYGAPINASEIATGAKACVKITASNLVFDCNGYSINSSGAAGMTYGIALNGSLSNVTVKNCQIWTYNYSILANLSTDSLKLTDIATDTWILLNNTSNSDFEQLNVSGSLTTSKIEGAYIYNSVFRNINMQNASYFYLYRVSNITVDGANVSGHNQFWFEIDAANDSLIQNVNASDIMYTGFYSDGSVDNYNTIYRNFNISTIKSGYWGFDFYNMHNCTAENINIRDAIGTNTYGMDTWRTSNSTIRNVNITNNEKPGMYIECQNTSISNVVIDGTAGAGVYLYHDGTFSGNNNITGLVIRNSQDYAIYSQPGTLPNFLNNVLIYNATKYIRLQSDVNFTSLTLGYSDTQGLIKWNSLNLANGTDLVNGTNIILDPYFVSLDSNSSGASQLNSSANVTVATESCAGQVYKLDGFPLNRTVIYTNGTLYTPFGYDSCSGTLRTFAVDAFSGYATSVTTPVMPSGGGGGGGAALKHFTITATQVCPGNKIDVYASTSSGALVGANVRDVLSDPYEGLITQDTTDATGHVVFVAGTEGTYTFRATKIGYANPSNVDLRFTYCSGEAPPAQNVTPPQPPAGGNVTPPTNGTQPPSNPDMGPAQQAISDAQSAISDAGAGGKDTSGARSKLDEAQAAFDAGNYQQALELANQAKQLALGAAAPVAPVKPTPPVTPTPIPTTPAAANPCPVTLIIIGAVVLIALAAGAYMMFGSRPRASRK